MAAICTDSGCDELASMVLGCRCLGCGRVFNADSCEKHGDEWVALIARKMVGCGGTKTQGCGGTIQLLEAMHLRSAVSS